MPRQSLKKCIENVKIEPKQIYNCFFLSFAEYGTTLRTLAARKAFDEPLSISIRRAEERFHPYTRESSSTSEEDVEEGPINLEIPKETVPPPPTPGVSAHQGVYNNGELTIGMYPRNT